MTDLTKTESTEVAERPETIEHTEPEYPIIMDDLNPGELETLPSFNEFPYSSLIFRKHCKPVKKNTTLDNPLPTVQSFREPSSHFSPRNAPRHNNTSKNTTLHADTNSVYYTGSIPCHANEPLKICYIICDYVPGVRCKVSTNIINVGKPISLIVTSITKAITNMSEKITRPDSTCLMVEEVVDGVDSVLTQRTIIPINEVGIECLENGKTYKLVTDTAI